MKELERAVIEAAYTEYRRNLVDPTTAQPWHALPTEQRIAFTKAFAAIWNMAMTDAANTCARLSHDPTCMVSELTAIIADRKVT